MNDKPNWWSISTALSESALETVRKAQTLTPPTPSIAEIAQASALSAWQPPTAADLLRQYDISYRWVEPKTAADIALGFRALAGRDHISGITGTNAFYDFAQPYREAALLKPSFAETISSFSSLVPAKTLTQIAQELQAAADQWRWKSADWEALTRARDRYFLPGNLLAAGVTIKEAYDFIDDVELPIYLVPRAEHVEKLLRWKTPRAVLYQYRDDILDDCEQIIDQCTGDCVRTEVPFARKVIAAARDGHFEAAQALVASTLETLVRRHHSTGLFIHDPEDPLPESLRADPRTRIALSPVRVSYRRWKGGQGEPVPFAFGRHPTAHRVSTRQMSIRSSIQATMVLVSYLGYIHECSTGKPLSSGG